MKYLPSQIIYLMQNRRTRRNIRTLAEFLLVLGLFIVAYSVIFHFLMALEGRDYSMITGFYWTLTVMSTLGFGDITFVSDPGKIFSIIVLLSGIVFLLIMLPFAFIQFFYAPWLEAQSKSRAPRQLPEQIAGHVIITGYNPIAIALVRRLSQYGHDYVILVPEVAQALDLVDQGLQVLVGELDDPDTYVRARIDSATLVLAINDDMKNTSIAFIVRGIAPQVPIAANADSQNSVDILTLAGCNHVFQFMNMLGQALARRTLGRRALANIIYRSGELAIAATPAMQTRLVGRTIGELGLRQQLGVNVVGLWNRGQFILPRVDSVIEASSVVVVAGSEIQLANYDNYIGGISCAEAPVLILGGGRVGQATAAALREEGIDYRIIEKSSRVGELMERVIVGSADDHDTLVKAGIRDAPSVFITTHSDEMNIYLTIYCRRLRPDIRIICRSNLDRNISVLHAAGADMVMSHASMAANNIINLLSPGKVLILTEGLNIFRHRVHLNLAGKTLVSSNIRRDTGCSIIAIRRRGETMINPDPAFELDANDEMIMIGTAESEHLFTSMYPEKA